MLRAELLAVTVLYQLLDIVRAVSLVLCLFFAIENWSLREFVLLSCCPSADLKNAEYVHMKTSDFTVKLELSSLCEVISSVLTSKLYSSVIMSISTKIAGI